MPSTPLNPDQGRKPWSSEGLWEISSACCECLCKVAAVCSARGGAGTVPEAPGSCASTWAQVRLGGQCGFTGARLLRGSGCTKAPSRPCGCRKPLGRQDAPEHCPLGQKDEAKLPHTTPAPCPLVSCPSGSGSLSCASQCVELEGWWDEEMRGTSGHSLYRKKEEGLFHFPIILNPSCFHSAWFGARHERGKGCGL